MRNVLILNVDGKTRKDAANKMHELAKEIIERRIHILLNEWNFEKRKVKHSDECVCYQQDKKCHDIEDLNCFFCYCPNYDMSAEEGKCRINSPKAKYIDTPKGKILDCSDCGFPHKKENAKRFLRRIYRLNNNII